MDVKNGKIYEMAESIWMEMLRLELCQTLEPAASPDSEGSPMSGSLMSCVQITGDWTGAVMIRCAADLARLIAAAMFDSEPDDLTAEEVLRQYVTRDYAHTRNYEETARRLELDRRTVKKYIDGKLLEKFTGGNRN